MTVLNVLNRMLDFNGKVAETYQIDEQLITIFLRPDDVGFINTFELADMCKKRALRMGYTLESRLTQRGNGACKVKFGTVLTDITDLSEQLAIIKAMGYVLDREGKNA